MTSRQVAAPEAALVPLFLGKQRCNVTFLVDSSENMRAALGSVKRLLIQTLLTKASLRDSLFNIMTFSGKQPHHILQKRLLEAKLSRGRMNMCGVTPNNRGVLLGCAHFNSHEEEEEDEEDFICVPCKCLGQEVNVLIDTGCKLNLMSSLTVERSGLKDLVEETNMQTGGSPFQRRLCIDGHIRELSLTLGQLRIMCSFHIVECDRPLISLGNKTLKSLKCVIDTDKQMLVFGTAVREQLQFAKKPSNERSWKQKNLTKSFLLLPLLFLHNSSDFRDL